MPDDVLPLLDRKPALERALSLGASCSQCPLADKLGPVYFKPKASSPAYSFDVTIVAERPGDTELGKGEPLAGRSGWLLQKMLKEMHVKYSEVHLTNATLCTTRTLLQEKDWSNAVNCCRPRLANELGNKRLQLVFLLGKRALQSVTGKDSIKAWRGFPVSPLELFDHENTIYFPTYHPSHILREPAYAGVWKLDFQRAFAYAAGRLKPVEWPETLIEDEDETIARLEHLLTHEVEKRVTKLATDVETAGKEPLLAKMLCQSIAVKEYAICLPRHSVHPEAWPLWKRILEHRNAWIVAQNGIHDTLSYEINGIDIEVDFDTLAAARVLMPNVDKDLGSLATYFYFIARHKSQYRKGGEADTKGEASWEKDSLDPVRAKQQRIYCARDSWTTLMIEEPLTRMLEGV